MTNVTIMTVEIHMIDATIGTIAAILATDPKTIEEITIDPIVTTEEKGEILAATIATDNVITAQDRTTNNKPDPTTIVAKIAIEIADQSAAAITPKTIAANNQIDLGVHITNLNKADEPISDNDHQKDKRFAFTLGKEQSKG